MPKLLTGLAAIEPVANKGRCLILGSMPSAVSIAEQQYYAHPRNSFWPIVQSELARETRQENCKSDTYSDRKKLLISNGIVLWDVLQHCQRQGSLDSAIKLKSIAFNDFEALWQRHPNIQHVLCNGATADKLFRQYLAQHKNNHWQDAISLHKLPSTSPAYAAMPYAKKLAQWQIALNTALSAQSRSE